MRHLKKGRKLGRKIGQRRALLKGLVGSLLREEEIVTTEAKAKELKIIAERLINKFKKILSSRKEEGLYAFRKIKSRIPSAVKKERLEEIAKRFAQREGGYTQIVKMAPRKSDGAKMAVIRILKD